jgi:hypothetical protein
LDKAGKTTYIKGKYTMTEKLPGMFIFATPKNNNIGDDKVLSRIGVFIDIVNWKSFGIQNFTTDELLMINPENPKDVGFYYETLKKKK